MELNWKECLEKGIITKDEPDKERAKQMLSLANLRYELIESMTDEKFTVFKIEAWYECIKELIFAHMYKNGYTSKNHICLIAYAKRQFDNFNIEIHKIDELRKVRNEIMYRGTGIDKDYLKRNVWEFKHIMKRLKKEIEA